MAHHFFLLLSTTTLNRCGLRAPQTLATMEMTSMDGNDDSICPEANGLNFHPALVVQQKRRGWFAECFGCEYENEYKVYGDGKDQIMNAREHSSCWARQCCGSMRPFTMSVDTKEGNELLNIRRPLHGRRGCFPLCLCFRWFECCHQSLEVFSGAGTSNPGKKIGRVREICICNPCVGHSYSVRDHKDKERYKVIGNCIGMLLKHPRLPT
eukprot:TRINITY_DN3937_c0_g1_i1.p1 TRINITY_DN3937_c0_g1~~TRINITY_DN3937_c0_g1_i1.p1  ORF type:complete len:246 (+),score=27.32 TRINITY_DN3937_c0_g1_i1:111-740(+)